MALPAGAEGLSACGSQIPGVLARDRLGPDALALLLGAKRVQVALRRWERLGDGSDLTGCVTVSAEPEQGAAFAAKLASLLLEDAVYAQDADVSYGAGGDPVLTFWLIGDRGQARLEVLPRAGSFRLHWEYKRGWWQMQGGSLAPVAARLWPMLRAAFPGTDIPSPPRPAPPPAFPESLPGVPPSVLSRIRRIVPGMKRRDVTQIFGMEGGLSSRSQRTYVYSAPRKEPREGWNLAADLEFPPILTGPAKRPGPAYPMTVKVDVEFAAPEESVVWLGGRGFVLRRSGVHGDGIERPDDIILRISPPYLGYQRID